MTEIQKMMKSMIGGTIATIIFIIVSFVLDNFASAKISTGIALIVGAICNFFMQQKAFLNTTKARGSHSWKFFVSEFFVLGSSQYGVSYLLDNKKGAEKYIEKKFKNIKKYEKYFNTFIRLFIAALVFIFVSFPIRKYFVFTA
jgi:hypothetical protein